MKLLHTSDWHLGRTLYGRRRYGEFEAFLDWLAQTMLEQGTEVLVVAGDIFDTTAPSNRAQQLYYRFLCQVAASPCRHVIIVAGNHDSPSFLNAPRELLRALDVHVIGNSAEDPQDEVLVLRDRQGTPEMIVCAVPYLRDRDIRQVEPGESVADKERKLLEGIRGHYAAVAELAQQQRDAIGVDVPIVATGHLFTAGGLTVDGDGVRELYVGSLAHITAGVFDPCFEYVALGHLHVPQKVGGSDIVRYSGSPLPMGFGEARQQKSLCQVTFDSSGGQRHVQVELMDIPTFQRLERIAGDWSAIAGRLTELAAIGESVWIEVIYQGEEIITDLREQLDAATKNTQLEVLRVKNTRVMDRVLGQMHEQETLDDLDVHEVFERCLAQHEVSDDQHPLLINAYQEIVRSIHEEDAPAHQGQA